MTHRSDSIRAKHISDPTRARNADNAFVEKSCIVRDLGLWRQRDRLTSEQAEARGLLTASQIASLAGVGTPTVVGWTKTRKHFCPPHCCPALTFPRPVAITKDTGAVLFERRAVLAYLAERARRLS